MEEFANNVGQLSQSADQLRQLSHHMNEIKD